MNKVYVRLLGEGTTVYRPVRAMRVSDFVFHLQGVDIYDPEDEEWEFPPDSIVVVEERVLEGERVLVATQHA